MLGENLTLSAYSENEEAAAISLFDVWVNSPEDYKNMINADYQEVGIGVQNSGGDIYAVLIFGTQVN